MSNDLEAVLKGVASIGIAAVAGKALFGSKDHDDYVKATYKSLNKNAGESTYIYVDQHHYAPSSSAGNTRGMDIDTTRHPDHVVKSGKGLPNLIIEVETEDSLNADAREQLVDFDIDGYSRVLVVPKGAVDAAEDFVSDLDGTVTVTTPKKIGAAVA